MRRLPVRGVVDGGLPQDFEKAVRILLSEPARPLLGDIRNCLSLDSEYLFYNKLTVGAQITTLLQSNGIQWPSSVVDDYAFRALHVALKSSRVTKRDPR